MKIVRILVTLSFSLIVVGCASKLRLSEHDTTATVSPTNQAPLKIKYLGVGGHHIQFGEEVLITGPSFTNPHFLLTGPFIPLSSDHAKVDKYMPESSTAQMLLIGHAHYDHLLDAAYIMQKHTPNAQLLGSTTTLNTIANELPSERMINMEAIMGTRNHPGQWVYSHSGKSRVMAVKSSHAPHFMGIKFMQGKYKNPLRKLPWHAFGWKEGQTLAYVIDFLDEQQQPAYRIFYQDAASEEQNGVVPDLADGKGFDVAIICAPSFSQVKNYPESIINNTQSTHYILGHWEDFFGNDLDGEQKFVRNTDQQAFIKRLNAALPAGSHWTLPKLFHTYSFNTEGLLP